MMPDATSGTTCPRCGESSTGRFCTGCGAALGDVSCAACGVDVPAGARFCPECGATIGAGTAPRGAAHAPNHLPWIVGGAAILALLAFVAGVSTGRRSSAGGSDAAGTVASAEGMASPLGGAGIVAAPDISNMSPEERASRLFNRIMLYSEQGKMDSARFFAPMAIQAYEMIGPVDAHARYDIGVISAATGDIPRARAEADTILAAHPDHLLGLVLAMRAADLSKDPAASARYRKRLVAAAPAGRTSLKEYAEHSRDIDDALARAAAASK